LYFRDNIRRYEFRSWRHFIIFNIKCSPQNVRVIKQRGLVIIINLGHFANKLFPDRLQMLQLDAASSIFLVATESRSNDRDKFKFSPWYYRHHYVF
jgi:hypothetical protein